MTGRPGRVRHVQTVDIPRPRGQKITRDAAFHDLVDHLTGLLDDDQGDDESHAPETGDDAALVAATVSRIGT
jgi:NitT/TauT family transport system ATP-binding protein